MNIERIFLAFGSSSMIGMATQVAKGKITALFLSPAQFGYFNQASNFYALMVTLAQCGLFSALVRNGAQIDRDDDVRLRQFFCTNSLFLLGVSLLFALVSALLSRTISDIVFGTDEYHFLILLVALGIPFGVMAQLYRALLTARIDVKALFWSRVIADVSSVATMTVCLFYLDLRGAVIALVSLEAVFLLLSAVYVRRRFGATLFPMIGGKRSLEDLRINLVYGLTGLMTKSAGLIGILVVSRLAIDVLGPTANGFLAIALKISAVYFGAISASVGNYVLPFLTRESDVGRREVFLENANAFFTLAMFPVGVGIIIFGEWVIRLIFTEAFVPAAAIVAIFVAGDFLRLLQESIATTLISYGAVWTGVFCRTVQVAVFIATSYLLVDLYELAGIGYAYLISYACGACISWVAVRVRAGHKVSLVTLLASLGAAASIMLFSTQDTWIGPAALVGIGALLGARYLYYRKASQA